VLSKDYLFPDGSDMRSSLVFKFSEPQDLSKYKYVKIEMSFEDEQTNCVLSITDIGNNTKNFNVGPTISPDNNSIDVSVNRGVYAFKIPLDDGMNPVNRRVIQQITWNVSTEFSKGAHSFIVLDVTFYK
jgi:hypothetical protein